MITDAPTMPEFQCAVRAMHAAISDVMAQHDMPSNVAIAALGAIVGAWLGDDPTWHESLEDFIRALRNTARARAQSAA
jgi:hypothetical protein